MGSLSNIFLLYIEDEDGIRNSITRSLSILTDNVATAENGVKALEYLQSHTVDLIITDIQMPQMDGLSLIEALRQQGIDTPVIITSAFNEIEYLNKAIDLKVDKFIKKPIRISNLIEVITKVAESINSKKLLHSHLQELENYREAINQTNFVLQMTSDGTVTHINQDLQNYFHSYTQENPIISLSDLFNAQDSAEILKSANEYKIFTKTTSIKLADEHFSVFFTAFASKIQENKILEISIMINDITPVIKEKEEIIKRLYTDTLTNLPNRTKLFEDLTKDESQMALLIIDIEDFSNINHLYGFDAGDQILVQMARLLEEYWPDERPRTLYRTDTDHFVILTPKMENFNPEFAKPLAMKLIKRIEAENFVIANALNVNISVTISGSCLGEQDLFSEATMALAVAKSRKLSFVCFADISGIRNLFENNIMMQGKIKTALCKDLIVNYYQPLVDADGSLIKYEALVRMIDPEDPSKVLTPYHFLHIAQQSKNYPLLTRKVMTNAFRDFGESDIGFSVNLSYDDIANPETTSYLESLFIKHPKAKVTLELLESESLKNIKETIVFFNRMKAYGAKIAIDDFGSGYSNFSHFFDMPLDILKIDGSLVKRIHEHRGYLALKTIIQFAENLGIQTVAEFVEDKEIFEKLQGLGVNMYQGYYFAQPKPFDEL